LSCVDGAAEFTANSTNGTARLCQLTGAIPHAGALT
jgi:hypothetical protein